MRIAERAGGGPEKEPAALGAREGSEEGDVETRSGYIGRPAGTDFSDRGSRTPRGGKGKALASMQKYRLNNERG